MVKVMKSRYLFIPLLITAMLSSCAQNSIYVEGEFFDKDFLKSQLVENLPDPYGEPLVYRKEHGNINASVYVEVPPYISSDYASFFAADVYHYLKEKSFKHLYAVDGQAKYNAPIARQFAYKLKEADKLSEFCNNSYCSVQSRELVNTWTFVFTNGDFKENDDGDKYMESPHCIVVSVEDTYHLSYHGKTISYNYFVEIDTHSSFWLHEE